MSKFTLASLLALCLSALPAQAELFATPLPGDTRLVQFEYDSDNTFLILSRPKSLTHIEFGMDERIQTVAGGDTKHWELTPTQNRRHLFVKPIYEQMETSMTVITDKRTYQFVLRSTGPGAKWYQRVTWRYGQTMLLDMREAEEKAAEAEKAARVAEKERQEQTLAIGVNPKDLRFDYTVEGNAAFRPVSLFDDGKFTWIRMPSRLVELPALFGVTETGETSIVNYVVQGDYMLAQRVMERGVLKLGKQEVRFARTKPSTPLGWLLGNGSAGSTTNGSND
ncbi:MAG: TrbG/VirB9 family P-type conjugative transfer protein [Burkholderiaceae bacterium]|nr:TrbG/VirB9 family P-type conjugative transfer protein [Burkholderiaceae bacterium]MDP3136280.1 TrbG/VirB9 family P-type conjugative transfer protein [Burkholderiaceae bacterium]